MKRGRRLQPANPMQWREALCVLVYIMSKSPSTTTSLCSEAFSLSSSPLAFRYHSTNLKLKPSRSNAAAPWTHLHNIRNYKRIRQRPLHTRAAAGGPLFLRGGDHSSDPFFDEADELLSFMDMIDIDGDNEHDYVIYEGSDEYFINTNTNSYNNSVVVTQYANIESEGKGDSNENVDTVTGTDSNKTIWENMATEIESKTEKDADEDDQSDDDMDNLIVPDLDTLLSNIQLAPASEIAYFYLQNTIGLEPSVMWKITNEDGSVLGFTVQNLEHKINLLRRMMNLSDDDVKIIITKQPSILHMSANRNISPTILYLVRAMDLSKEDLRRMVVAYPCILCYSIHNLAGKIGFFEQTLGMAAEDVRELLVDEPKLFCAAVHSDTGLMAKFDFLHGEMGIPLKDLRKIVRANPRILLYSLRDNLQEKLISFFIMRFHMEPRDIVKLLTAYPQIMDYNLENHLLPIARYFLTELEFGPMEMRRMLLKFPRLMTFSLFKIKHVVGYLRYQLGMDANEVKRILFQAPQVISLSTDDTLVSKVLYLKDAFGLVKSQDLRKVIAGMPTLLLCNVQNNLMPKRDYLLQEFDGDEFELRQAILTLPTLMGYSLEKRIRPRMMRIKDLGIPAIKITVGITMTDDNFEKWLFNKNSRTRNGGILVNSSKHKRSKKKKKRTGEVKEINDLEEQELSARIVHWKR